MGNENSPPLVPAKNAGGNPPSPNNGTVAEGKQPVQPPVVSASSAKPPELFGGHRGGGKKRRDGLVAGSPEAIEADKRADAERKRVAYHLKKGAALPPTLPSAASSSANAPAPLVGSPSPVSGADPAPVVAPVGAAPMFVPWTQRLLERPAKLATKIIDRLRCHMLMKRVRKLKLTPEQEKEIAGTIKWKDEVTEDFKSALAECATIELNKRKVPGANNSHLLNVVLCGGEMVTAHLQSLEAIEKMVAENNKAAAIAKGG